MNVLRVLSLAVVCSLAPTYTLAQEIIAEIRVSQSESAFIAVNDVTHRVYAFGDDDAGRLVLSVVDGLTNTLIDTVEIGLFPKGLAVDSAANRVFVGGDNTDGEWFVVAIDGVTNQVVQTWNVLGVEGLAVNPATHRVYVATDALTVIVLDGDNGALLATVDTVPLPIFTVDPIRNIIHVVGNDGFGNRLVQRIDGDTHELLEPFVFPPDLDVRRFTFNLVTNRMTAVVSDGTNGNTLALLMDGATGAILNSRVIGVAVDPIAVAVNTVADRVYVVGQGDTFPQRIITIDGATGELLSDRPIEMMPEGGMVVDGELNRLYGAGMSFTEPTAVVWVVDITERPRDADAPELTVPDEIRAEAGSSAGTDVAFTVFAVDAVDGPVAVTCSHDSGAVFPLGVTVVQCSASDAEGNTANGSFAIFVGDTTPPSILSVTPSQTHLWPPNNDLVPVTFAVSAADAVSAPSCLIAITSTSQQASDPTDMLRDGPLSMRLRAERENGVDRIYSIQVACRDAAGNTAVQWTTVTVGKP